MNCWEHSKGPPTDTVLTSHDTLCWYIVLTASHRQTHCLQLMLLCVTHEGDMLYTWRYPSADMTPKCNSYLWSLLWAAQFGMTVCIVSVQSVSAACLGVITVMLGCMSDVRCLPVWLRKSTFCVHFTSVCSYSWVRLEVRWSGFGLVRGEEAEKSFTFPQSLGLWSEI